MLLIIINVYKQIAGPAHGGKRNVEEEEVELCCFFSVWGTSGGPLGDLWVISGGPLDIRGVRNVTDKFRRRLRSEASSARVTF
jgi:hypothetical protein